MVQEGKMLRKSCSRIAFLHGDYESKGNMVSEGVIQLIFGVIREVALR